MADLLLDKWWAGPLLWMGLYVSDYYLTITCAALYRAQEKVVFEGSFEITPNFQADVDLLRKISPRFVLALAGSTAYLLFVRAIAGPSSGLVGFYQLVLGAMILIEATVHVRHLRNWFLFRWAVRFLEGRLFYPRGVMLRASAFEFVVFSALWTILSALTASLFLLGGALACAGLSVNHHRLARRHEKGRP